MSACYMYECLRVIFMNVSVLYVDYQNDMNSANCLCLLYNTIVYDGCL